MRIRMRIHTEADVHERRQKLMWRYFFFACVLPAVLLRKFVGIAKYFRSVSGLGSQGPSTTGWIYTGSDVTAVCIIELGG